MAMGNISPQISNEVIEACPVGVITTDKNGNIIFVNQSLEEILGISAGELTGTNMDTIPRDDLKTLFSHETMLQVQDAQGKRRILYHTQVSPKETTKSGEANEEVTCVHYYQDHTELFALQEEKARLDEEVSNLRLNDPATGLLTERALFLALEPQVSRCRRYNNPLSVIFMVNQFVDETQSTDEIDIMRLQITHLLREQLRWADLTGRIDPYFAIALPETSKEAASKLVAKIAGKLEKLEGIKSSSFGISEWKKGDNTASLLRRADEAALEAIKKQEKPSIVLL